jgi:hypothetical protein
VSPVRYELDCYIPEDDILHSHRRENLKSYITFGFYNIFGSPCVATHLLASRDNLNSKKLVHAFSYIFQLKCIPEGSKLSTKYCTSGSLQEHYHNEFYFRISTKIIWSKNFGAIYCAEDIERSSSPSRQR